jgi:murE/murF fusion protein
MLIGNYLKNINQKYLRYSFSGISADSNKIKSGNIFFAIKGNVFDGNEFINNAIKNGARIIISENCNTEVKNNILYIKSNNVRKLLAEFAFKIFNNKFKKLIAVTGTNGKSSIANFFYQILKLNKKKVAAIGTLGIKSEKFNLELKNTTIDPLSLSKYLNILKKNKIDYVILEASSHGLKQNRLDGLLFDIGIFTNLSHDHLDYHKNLKNYLDAKLYLFKELIKKNGNVITDNEIPQFKKIGEISNKNNLKLRSISTKKSDLQLISHHFENENQNLIIKYKNNFYKFRLNLIGKIQVKNILMTILAALECGLKIQNIIKILEKIRPIEGRLEKIGHIKNNSKIILDYAHTPEALLTSLKNLKEQFPNTSISIVFGCGGNRDKKKRAKMGRIAARYCNQIYLTDDNPRNENPKKIREDIKKGIFKKKYEEIPNRKLAIRLAIERLKSGQILLVAGKGHEKTQEFSNKKIYFSDKQEILKSIKIKNNTLSKNLKLNLIKDLSKTEIDLKNFNLNNICINSKELKKNDIFFAIKGKNNDGYDFIGEVIKKKASLVVTHKINKRFNLKKQIKVNDTLIFLTMCSQLLRNNVNSKIIAITGSCGKTTLKDFIGEILSKFYKVYYSPKSFNNKYGVPLSLFNLNPNHKFGIFEIGMDKKGEIDQLSKIVQPDVGIITNINFAHAKNFKNLKGIAEAKSEIINNIKKNGSIILNADDKFFEFHRKLAIKNGLKIISFGIKNKSANIKFLKISKIK